MAIESGECVAVALGFHLLPAKAKSRLPNWVTGELAKPSDADIEAGEALISPKAGDSLVTPKAAGL